MGAEQICRLPGRTEARPIGALHRHRIFDTMMMFFLTDIFCFITNKPRGRDADFGVRFIYETTRYSVTVAAVPLIVTLVLPTAMFLEPPLDVVVVAS